MSILSRKTYARLAAITTLVVASVLINVVPANAAEQYGGSFDHGRYNVSVSRTTDDSSIYSHENVCDNHSGYCWTVDVAVHRWTTGTQVAITQWGSTKTVWFDANRRLNVAYTFPEMYLLNELRSVRTAQGSAYREMTGNGGARFVDVRYRDDNGVARWIRFDRTRINASNDAIFELNNVIGAINTIQTREYSLASVTLLGVSGLEYTQKLWGGLSGFTAFVGLCGVSVAVCGVTKSLRTQAGDASNAVAWLMAHNYGYTPHGGS